MVIDFEINKRICVARKGDFLVIQKTKFPVGEIRKIKTLKDQFALPFNDDFIEENAMYSVILVFKDNRQQTVAYNLKGKSNAQAFVLKLGNLVNGTP